MPLPRSAFAALTGSLGGVSRYAELQFLERLRREQEEREFGRKQQLAEEDFSREQRLREFIAGLEEEQRQRERQEPLSKAEKREIRLRARVGARAGERAGRRKRAEELGVWKPGMKGSALGEAISTEEARIKGIEETRKAEESRSLVGAREASAEASRALAQSRLNPQQKTTGGPTVNAMRYAEAKGEQMANAWLQQQLIQVMRQSEATDRSREGILGFGAKQVSPEEIEPSEFAGEPGLEISKPETRELWFAQYPQLRSQYEQIRQMGILQGVSEYQQIIRLYGIEPEISEAAMVQSEADEVEPVLPEELPSLDEVMGGQ